MSWFFSWFKRWQRPQPPKPPAQDPDPPSSLASHINDARRRSGLDPLAVCDRLTAQAQAHAERMDQTGRMSHDGFLNRLHDAGYWTGSENVAHGQRTPAECVNDWMNSTSHRKNILGPFNVGGTGRSGNYWCALFAA